MTAAAEVRVGGRALPLPAAMVRRIARAVLAGERRAGDVSLSITFLGPAAMRRMNREYKGHDRPTDVLAFALEGPDGALAGDVYVCRAAAARSARAHGVPLREELVRLVIHGVLHVLGHDHPETDARVRSPMWRRQERYARALA